MRFELGLEEPAPTAPTAPPSPSPSQLHRRRRHPALLARFRTVRAATMNFCAPLIPEDMMVQSCAEASPVKWHLAHTSWFFETFVLSEFVAGYQPFHPDFRWLFNSYYNALGEMPEKKLRASFSRPPLDQILAYRATSTPPSSASSSRPRRRILRRIALGLEHEQQHLELAATDIKHAFFTNPLHPAYVEPPPSSRRRTAIAPPLDWLSFTPGAPGHRRGIGVTPDPADIDSLRLRQRDPAPPRLPRALPSRLPPRHLRRVPRLHRRRRLLPPRALALRRLGHLRAEGWQAPLYWRRDDSTTPLRLEHLHPARLPPLGDLSETPVCHLSFFEADAFARWSGHRLPTEFEWEFVAAQHREKPSLRRQLPRIRHLHPSPAAPPLPPRSSSSATSGSGRLALHRLPRLQAAARRARRVQRQVHVLADGPPRRLLRHPATHIRATYRNFFSPATRWQFSGLRLARDGAS
jgi:hypothetical protein